MQVGPSKCVKQIIHIKLNRVKNPNWPEANQLAIYKHGRGSELGKYREQIQLAVIAGLEFGMGSPNCKSSALTTSSGSEAIHFPFNMP